MHQIFGISPRTRLQKYRKYFKSQKINGENNKIFTCARKQRLLRKEKELNNENRVDDTLLLVTMSSVCIRLLKQQVSLDTYYFICKEIRAVTSWEASRNTRGRKITSRWRWAILNHRKRNIVTM